MFAPLLWPAHASAMVSSILLANSGGVNTSSLERFAMHVNTSGLRPRSEKFAWPFYCFPRIIARGGRGKLAYRIGGTS